MTGKLIQESNAQNPTANASLLVQELLDRVIKAAESGSPEGTPASMHTGLAGTLRRLVDEVRAEYLLLADREIAGALETALGVSLSLGTGQGKEVGRDAGEPSAFDALEALILGAEPEQPTIENPVSLPDEHSPVTAMSSEAPAQDATLYEGTVRLYVNAEGNMQRVIRFLDDIGHRPQFRVLRMTGNPQREGAEIDHGLREPTAFVELLHSMGHATEPIDASSDGIPEIIVRLHGLVSV